MAVLYTPHFIQFFDNDGNPLAGGKLYTYAAGTTTPKAAYTDQSATVNASNPVILDSAGRTTIWIDGAYKFRLETAAGVLVEETDNVTAYTPAGSPIISNDEKLAEQVSVKDYGAVGNGTTDDTAAFVAALAAHDHVFVPSGEYYLTSTLLIDSEKDLWGAGKSTILKFRAASFDKDTLPAAWNTTTDGVQLKGFGARVSNFRIVGANAGLVMLGVGKECTGNIAENIEVWDCVTGVKLSGGTDTNYPCYWNRLFNVLVERPRDIGFHLTKGSGGDSANKNTLLSCRVYSHGQAMTNTKYGFFLENAKNGNCLIDCEANLATNATACMYFDDDTGDNTVVNFTSECLGSAPGISFHANAGNGTKGPQTIIDHRHQTGGADVYDPAYSGYYNLINSGSKKSSGAVTDRHKLYGRLRVGELLAESLIHSSYEAPVADTDYVLDANIYNHLVPAGSVDRNVIIPEPSAAIGMRICIRRTTGTAGRVVIRRASLSNKVDQGYNFRLDTQFASLELYCDGSGWYERGKVGTISGI